MKLKKNINANLEKKRNIFLETGLIVAIGFALMAFEWKIYISKPAYVGIIDSGTFIEDITPVIRPEEKPKPIPPQANQLKIVLNTESINLDPLIQASDIGEKDIIQFPDIALSPEIIEEDSLILEPFLLDENPVFPGGNNGLLKFIKENINYPPLAKANNIEGCVYISFVVNKKGEIENIKIQRSVDSELDKEALRVVGLLPKWTPGKQKNRPINSYFRLPIKFVLK